MENNNNNQSLLVSNQPFLSKKGAGPLASFCASTVAQEKQTSRERHLWQTTGEWVWKEEPEGQQRRKEKEEKLEESVFDGVG